MTKIEQQLKHAEFMESKGCDSLDSAKRRVDAIREIEWVEMKAAICTIGGLRQSLARAEELLLQSQELLKDSRWEGHAGAELLVARISEFIDISQGG